MHSPACRTDQCRQSFFERCLTIFIRKLDTPITLGVRGDERLEAALDGVAVFGREQPLCVQHLSMGDRGACVIGNKALIESVIFSRRVLQHALIERCALVPESCHARAECAAASSAGASLPISATTSVPVPSLVKTSAKIASAAL